MKKRFTLQFPDQEESDLIALLFINYLGRKKSKFISSAVNNYLLDIEKIVNDHVDDEVMIERLDDALKQLYGEDFSVYDYIDETNNQSTITSGKLPKVKVPSKKKPVVDLNKFKQEIDSNTPKTNNKETLTVKDGEQDDDLRSNDHKVLAKQGISTPVAKDTSDELSEVELLKKELAEKEAKLKEVSSQDESIDHSEPEDSQDDLEKMKLASSALDFFK